MAKGRFKRKGKSKFIMIEGYIMRSAAWSALTPNDKAAYIELKWRYDGLNNGRVGLGERELAAALGIGRDTARRALVSLIEKGFLAKAKASGFNVKNRIATEWRLTEYPCDKSGHPATKDFMKWQPEEKTQAHHRSAQAHYKASEDDKRGQNSPHRRTTGPVKPISVLSQAHHRSTYSITRGGGVDDDGGTRLITTLPVAGVSAPPNGAEANPRAAQLLETSFLKRAANGKAA